MFVIGEENLCRYSQSAFINFRQIRPRSGCSLSTNFVRWGETIKRDTLQSVGSNLANSTTVIMGAEVAALILYSSASSAGKMVVSDIILVIANSVCPFTSKYEYEGTGGCEKEF